LESIRGDWSNVVFADETNLAFGEDDDNEMPATTSSRRLI
jgi:hypothetical protein